MGLQRFTNLASGTLAGSITSESTSLTLTSGQGALFPSLSAGDWFMGILVTSGQSASASSEIVMGTAKSTDTFAIVRAQEGTTAAAWAAGTQFSLVPTAGTYGNFAQPGTLQAQAGNYALDTGSANAYVVTLTPALGSAPAGVPIRWLAGHTNTGNSTFNSEPLLSAGGSQLPAAMIQANGIYECIWNTALSAYQLINAGQYAASTFTPSWTGFSVNPTASAIGYTINGGLASIIFPVDCYGTSGGASGTSLVIGGLPAILQPSAIRNVPIVGLTNNGAAIAGGMAAINGSSITLFPDGTGGVWSASGTKGITAVNSTVVYPL